MGIVYFLCCVLHFLILLSSFKLINALIMNDSVAYLSSSWVNTPFSDTNFNSKDNSSLRPILYRRSNSSGFICGFFCNYACDGYLFAVVIFQPAGNDTKDISPYFYLPKVVWSANRNNLVRDNATLTLTQEGELILKEADGTLVWSTYTSGKSVAHLNLTETGNLVLFDQRHASVWQSFDHPTDCLLPDQKLVFGQKLTASALETNWSQGAISFWVTNSSVVAYVESNPPQIYYSDYYGADQTSVNPGYVIFRNGGLFLSSGEKLREFALTSSAQYMKLEPAGQLRVSEWVDADWTISGDVFYDLLDCQYPLICGKYGICFNKLCSCPGPADEGATYFRPVDYRHSELGCSLIVPISCEASEYHSLIEFKDTAYFYLENEIQGVDKDGCKMACLRNCSCKAVFLIDDDGTSLCYLSFEVFSLMNTEMLPGYSTAFIKVQNIPKTPVPSPDIAPSPTKTRHKITVILGSVLGVLFGFLTLFGIWLSVKRKDVDNDKEDYMCEVPGMPSRLSHEMLIAATENFSRKLGEGGCGSVFEGTLSNGSKVAVKRLEGLGEIKKSFLAEVETIGSIHHINLVRLIGYCAENSHLLLVYEYMCNGSLDKWIFNPNKAHSLDWKTRKRIIMDIAKGLNYLHEECRQKIIHLDIKPQNILLDENFNAKVSDFGLSKLIDRDRSSVMTTMRGTPGYMAPEWLSSFITEKADIYSFGVVILEILCGRKNLDRSQSNECMHLLSLFKEKVEDKKLLDIVDKNIEDIQLHGAEVVKMMKVGAWCLQSDVAKRPSMSVVIKVLEGTMDVEDNLDYNFFNPTVPKTTEVILQSGGDPISHVSPSVLSGPR